MSSPSIVVLTDLYSTVQIIQDKMKYFLSGINAMLNGLDWMNNNIQDLIKKSVPFEFMDSDTVMKQHREQLKNMQMNINNLFTTYGKLVYGLIDEKSDSLQNAGVFNKFLNLGKNSTTTDVVIAINEILAVYNAKNNKEFISTCDDYFISMRELLYMFMFNVDGTIDRNNKDEMYVYNIILGENAYYSRLPYVMNNIGFLLLSFLNYINNE